MRMLAYPGAVRAAGISLLLCFPSAVLSADSHREAVLRLVAASAAIAEGVRRLPDGHVLAVLQGSRMAAPECTQFLQDIVSLKNVEVITSERPAWTPRPDATHVAVRWRGKRELLLEVTFKQFEVRDASAAAAACSVSSVNAREWGEWHGKLAPMLLDVPGAARTPPQVFPVDPGRGPSVQSLLR